LGVKKIMLVNDIEWLGGQFSSKGVGCSDKWTGVNGRRVNFPRSGFYKEVIDRIRTHNSQTYGPPSPGNAYCGTETTEPAAAIFEQLVKPHVDSGVLRIERGVWLSEDDSWLQPGNDHDEDNRKDIEDPLPFDSSNNNAPDRLEYLP